MMAVYMYFANSCVFSKETFVFQLPASPRSTWQQGKPWMTYPE
jgi:hypothetical protein